MAPGANDGLISTASLMVGGAAAGTERADILVAGVGRLSTYVRRPTSTSGSPAARSAATCGYAATFGWSRRRAAYNRHAAMSSASRYG